MSTKKDPKMLCDFAEIVNTTLSSKDTFFLKYVFTPGWIILYWPAVLFAIRNLKDWKLYALFSILWMIFLIYFCCSYVRVKDVRLSGEKFIVSNFAKTIRIDISEVESIGGSFFLYPDFIWLILKNKSEFGKKIIFIAKPRETFLGILAFRRHPWVEKLTNYCKAYGEIV
ncbi:MAG: hypothetical protein ACYSUS_03175 [Planctomycetota bacterium]|jgi:hypothetical protein